MCHRGKECEKARASVCDRELEASFRLDPRDEWLLCDPAEYCEAADEDDRDAVYLGPVEGDLLLDQVAEGLDCFVFDDKPDLAWSDEEECRAALGLEDED